jgi:hypothetical protein
MWAVLGAIALSATHVAQAVVRAWQEIEQRQEFLHRLGSRLVSSPWTYVTLAVVAVWLWRWWYRREADGMTTR